MKIILSAKYLAQQLSKFNFDLEDIHTAQYKDNLLYLVNRTKTIEINCEILVGDESIIGQHGARWDAVKNLVNQIDEQPIIIHLRNDNCEIILQY